MSTIITMTTALATAGIEESSHLFAALFTSARTSMPIPYKFIAALADDATAAKLAARIINGETIDLDTLTAKDASIKHDARYMAARAKETPDLVRVDKSGNTVPRRTTPAALVRRFIVPAVEPYIDACILAACGIDPDGMTPEHVATLAKRKATTDVQAKLTHYTRGTSTADKNAHNARRMSRAERKRAAREAAAAKRAAAKETPAA